MVFWVWPHLPLFNPRCPLLPVQPRTTVTGHPESRPKAAAGEDVRTCGKRGHKSKDEEGGGVGRDSQVAKQDTGLEDRAMPGT